MKTYEITDTKIENKACYLVIKGKKEATSEIIFGEFLFHLKSLSKF